MRARRVDDAMIRAPMTTAIRCSALRKTYAGKPPVEAVRGLELEVAVGECFGLLGPNGAGKTTTVEILEGFRTPTAGSVRVLGEDPAGAGAAWRARIGVVLQESEQDPLLTVRETLRAYAGYYPAPRDVEETIALATASLWRWPPERWTTHALRFSTRPVSTSTSSTGRAFE